MKYSFLLLLAIFLPGCSDTVEDTTPPALTFAGTHLDTSNPVHLLSGTLEEGARLEISVNEVLLPEEDITISGESWSTTITLDPGTSQVLIKALDDIGNNRSLILYLNYDALTIESYITPIPDGESGLLLSGLFDPSGGEVPLLLVEDEEVGVEVSVDGVTWSHQTIGLVEGDNSITVTLAQAEADPLETSLTIKVDPDAPLVSMDQRLLETDLPSLVVTGTIADAETSLSLTPVPLEGAPVVDSDSLTWHATLNRLQPGKNVVTLVASLSGTSATLRELIRLRPLNLQVNELTPASGAIEVGPEAAVLVEFDADVEPDSLTTASFFLTGNGGVVDATVSYDVETRIATLTPVGLLNAGSSYQVTLASTIESIAGVTLGQDLNWSFTTLVE